MVCCGEEEATLGGYSGHVLLGRESLGRHRVWSCVWDHWEHGGILPEALEEVYREKEVWVPLFGLLPDIG